MEIWAIMVGLLAMICAVVGLREEPEDTTAWNKPGRDE